MQGKGFQESLFTSSRKLLGYIRAEAPADKHVLIANMFEKIDFYEKRVTEAKAVKRADVQWDVTIGLHLARMEADAHGEETARAPPQLSARAIRGSEISDFASVWRRRIVSGN